MTTIVNIIRGYGVSKTVGSSQPRQFLNPVSSSKNIWFRKRRFAH